MGGLAILCSGQAGQRCDMLDDLLGAADCGPACAAASRVLGRDVAAWWAGLDAEALFANANAQFAIAFYQIATWGRIAAGPSQGGCPPRGEARSARGLTHPAAGLPPPRRVAGYSLGEVVAWHVAGALDAEATLRLVQARARLMDEYAPPGGEAGCLVLWRGGRAPALRAARDRAMAECGLAVAIRRPGGELVLGGSADSVRCFMASPGVAHPELKRLPVTVPSHTPRLAGAVAPFAAQLAASPLADARVPVIGGIDGASLYTREEAIRSLSRQLAETVRWDWCLDALAGAGVDVVLELGPGKDLAQLAVAEYGMEARAADEFGSPDALRAWVAARC